MCQLKLVALPENSIQLHEFVARDRTHITIMKFCSALRPDGQPIIDFGSLSKITVTIDDPNEGEALQELFRRCHTLQMHTYLVSDIFRDHKRFLIARSILVLEPQNVRQPTLSDILRPSMQTLRHIVVNIHVVIDGDDSLLDIPSEFEDMRTKNIIETVTIRILVRSYESYRLEEDHWVGLTKYSYLRGGFH